MFKFIYYILKYNLKKIQNNEINHYLLLKLLFYIKNTINF